MIRWVVTFQDNVIPDQVENLLAIAGIEIPEVTLSIPELLMRIYMLKPSIAKRLAKLPIVKFIEQDVKVKLVEPVLRDSDTSILQTSRQSGEVTPYGIELVQALQVDDSNVSNRMVCVIDSGYDLGHVDLPGTAVVTGSDTLGVQPWYEDDNSHGTHVTGTIAALGNNGQGVVGVNRNGELKLHIVRIFDETGQTFSSDTVAEIQDCINAGANVVSMSFGRDDSPLEFERQAFDQFYSEGTLLVAAAGNDGGTTYNWPASYSSVMSVAALDESKQVADFSQKNDAVDIAAPGVDVASTVPGDSYAFYSGTSMATPHVSGVAALVWSKFPDKSAQEIWEALMGSAQDLGDAGKDTSYGYGLVQAAAAIDFLTNGGSLPDDPTSSPPGQSPTPSPGECVDDSTWVDSGGDGCDWYSVPFLCQAFGPLYSNEGKTANEACCICGGGTSAQGDVGDSLKSSALQLSSTLSFLAFFGLVAVSIFS